MTGVKSPVITGQVHHEEIGPSSSQRRGLWIGVLTIWPMTRPTHVVETSPPTVPGCGREQHPPTQLRVDWNVGLGQVEDSGDLRSIRAPSVPLELQTRSPKDLKNAVQGLLCGEHINRLLFGARSRQSQPDDAARMVGWFCESVNHNYFCRAAPGMCWPSADNSSMWNNISLINLQNLNIPTGNSSRPFQPLTIL